MGPGMKRVSDPLGLPPGEHAFLAGKGKAGPSVPWPDLTGTHSHPGGPDEGSVILSGCFLPAPLSMVSCEQGAGQAC